MNSGSGDAHVVEPNLISLLDLVMQLLMFFIMCVTFVTDQSAAEISLPDSQAAAPIEDKDTNVQIVNIRPFNSNDPGLIAKYSGNPKYLEEMGETISTRSGLCDCFGPGSHVDWQLSQLVERPTQSSHHGHGPG